MIILGNLRMIHCVKNNDEQNTATIIWCEKFQEIASCVISCAVGYVPSWHHAFVCADYLLI